MRGVSGRGDAAYRVRGGIGFRGWLVVMAVGTAVVTSAGPAQAVSAYLPNYGELQVTAGTTYQTYNQAWQGKTFNNYTLDTRIHEVRLGASYGLTDRWAIDINGGYGFLDGGLGGTCNPADPANCQNPIPQGTRDGFLDTRIGLRYALVREDASQWDSLPTVALYVGGIIEGDYYPRPQALGDGSSGGEIGVGLGRYWSDIGVGVTADLSYNIYTNYVPNAFNGSLGVYKTFGQFFASAAYRFERSMSGWDTGRGPPGLGRIDGAVGRQENYELWEVGGGYTTESGTTIQGAYSDVFDGRNTAKRESFQLYVTFPTQLIKN